MGAETAEVWLGIRFCHVPLNLLHAETHLDAKMEVEPGREAEEKSNFRVLITGANRYAIETLPHPHVHISNLSAVA